MRTAKQKCVEPCLACGMPARHYMVMRRREAVIKGHLCEHCFSRLGPVQSFQVESVSREEFENTVMHVPEWFEKALAQVFGPYTGNRN